MNRPVARDRNDFDRHAAQRGGKAATSMAGNVDLTGHYATDTDNAAHHQHVKFQSFLAEEAFLLAIVKRHVAERRPRYTDEELVSRNAIAISKNNLQNHCYDQPSCLSHRA